MNCGCEQDTLLWQAQVFGVPLPRDTYTVGGMPLLALVLSLPHVLVLKKAYQNANESDVLIRLTLISLNLFSFNLFSKNADSGLLHVIKP